MNIDDRELGSETEDAVAKRDKLRREAAAEEERPQIRRAKAQSAHDPADLEAADAERERRIAELGGGAASGSGRQGPEAPAASGADDAATQRTRRAFKDACTGPDAPTIGVILA